MNHKDEQTLIIDLPMNQELYLQLDRPPVLAWAYLRVDGTITSVILTLIDRLSSLTLTSSHFASLSEAIKAITLRDFPNPCSLQLSPHRKVEERHVGPVH